MAQLRSVSRRRRTAAKSSANAGAWIYHFPCGHMSEADPKNTTMENPEVVVGVGCLLCLVLILGQQLNEISVLVRPFDQ